VHLQQLMNVWKRGLSVFSHSQESNESIIISNHKIFQKMKRFCCYLTNFPFFTHYPLWAFPFFIFWCPWKFMSSDMFEFCYQCFIMITKVIQMIIVWIMLVIICRGNEFDTRWISFYFSLMVVNCQNNGWSIYLPSSCFEKRKGIQQGN
jgi:hypothetical protein